MHNDINTKRLILRRASPDGARADIAERGFDVALGAQIATQWPPDLWDAEARASTLRGAEGSADDLQTYYILMKRPNDVPLAVGTIGFHAQPQDGLVEIGFSIVPQWQRIGIGAEATEALVRYAFEELGVTTVRAHTFPELTAAQRVLRKNGFVHVGPGEQPDELRFERTCAGEESNPHRSA